MRLGQTMFDDAYKIFTKNYGEIDVMKAEWVVSERYDKDMSDNLAEYLDNINNKGMNERDAIMNTNAGRKFDKIGFNEIEIKVPFDGSKIIVHFKKESIK